MQSRLVLVLGIVLTAGCASSGDGDALPFEVWGPDLFDGALGKASAPRPEDRAGCDYAWEWSGDWGPSVPDVQRLEGTYLSHGGPGQYRHWYGDQITEGVYTYDDQDRVVTEDEVVVSGDHPGWGWRWRSVRDLGEGLGRRMDRFRLVDGEEQSLTERIWTAEGGAILSWTSSYGSVELSIGSGKPTPSPLPGLPDGWRG